MIASDKTILAAVGLSRFGLGARRGDRARIESDPRGAVHAELATPGVCLLDGTDLESSGALLRKYASFRREQKENSDRRAAAEAAAAERKAGSSMASQGMSPESMSSDGMSSDGMSSGASAAEAMSPPSMADTAPPKPEIPEVHRQGRPVLIYRGEFQARLGRLRTAEIGYVERLVAFWANHFTASAARGAQTRVLAGAFEREAIRPHVLGRFGDMLLAVTRHPAMLTYLDNNLSTGPDSPAGKRRARGLNENHARELLELHTVGVHGGYDQADVTSLARVLTGWRSLPPRDDAAGAFAFDIRRHQPGAQTVMGKRYAEDGVAQGEAVLADLATSPATAAHLCERLACAFVADDPPPALVTRLSATFSATNGDLGAVARALVDSDEAWSAPPRKLRSPQAFTFASFRALDVWPKLPVVLKALNELGHPLWSPPSPKGFPLRGDEWLAPNALVNRLDLSEQIAMLAGDLEPLALADDLLGGRLTDESRTAIRRAGSRAQGLALLLMSPEMQRT